MSAMLRRLRWVIAGLNKPTPKKLHSSDVRLLPFLSLSQKELQLLDPSSPKPKPKNPKRPMLEAVHEIAIYIHRFHNLDLFQQGWYQIKITMRWENDEYGLLGTPARVVQYEAPDLGCDDAVNGIWKINDTDHSFSSQPFRIRYARQDVFLSMMVAFNFSLSKYEGLSTSAVILKFELMYAPVFENSSNLQASLDASPAAIHEFRLPPKSLLGLHSYCPVHFDAYHSVLLDTSVHTSLLKGGLLPASSQVQSDSVSHEVVGEKYDTSKQVLLTKAMVTAHNVLKEELQNLSKAINETVEIPNFTSSVDQKETDVHISQKVLNETNNVSEQADSNSQSDDGTLDSLSMDELSRVFHLFGNQTSDLWTTFLKFHRANKTKILEYLREQWAIDRRADWSIWMVYSKVEMPHQYISSAVGDSYHTIHGRPHVPRKLTDDPAQTAAMRVELHRRSIAQMKINNRSIQDLYIYGDPARIPIMIVERAVNAPLRSTSGNSYFSRMDQKNKLSPLSEVGSRAGDKLSGGGPRQSGRVLKIVVFVHGFQRLLVMLSSNSFFFFPAEYRLDRSAVTAIVEIKKKVNQKPLIVKGSLGAAVRTLAI